MNIDTFFKKEIHASCVFKGLFLAACLALAFTGWYLAGVFLGDLEREHRDFFWYRVNTENMIRSLKDRS